MHSLEMYCKKSLEAAGEIFEIGYYRSGKCCFA